MSATESLSGTSLGLTALQLCVNDQYGDCDLLPQPTTPPSPYPKVYFYATWPRMPGAGVYGRKFEH